jgi:hypothetical protein
VREQYHGLKLASVVKWLQSRAFARLYLAPTVASRVRSRSERFESCPVRTIRKGPGNGAFLFADEARTPEALFKLEPAGSKQLSASGQEPERLGEA